MNPFAFPKQKNKWPLRINVTPALFASIKDRGYSQTEFLRMSVAASIDMIEKRERIDWPYTEIENRTAAFSVKLNPVEVKALAKAAKRARMSVNEFVNVSLARLCVKMDQRRPRTQPEPSESAIDVAPEE